MAINKANLAGICAMLFWASTALFLSYCTTIPTLLLAGATSLIGFTSFVAFWLVRGDSLRERFRLPGRAVALAVIGIGAYRLLYFAAFKFAPAVEVSLFNYLWPVLIVLFTHFLPEERLKWHHVVGAVVGFMGVCVLFLRNSHDFGAMGLGHALALLAAIEWAAFSVLSRHTKGYSSNAVPLSFLATGVIFLVLHAMTNGEIAGDATAWVFATLLGVTGSLGYFLWDVGMKHGNVQILSVLSYSIPLISTILLVITGQAQSHPFIFAAALLVALGGIIAGWDKIRPSRKTAPV